MLLPPGMWATGWLGARCRASGLRPTKKDVTWSLRRPPGGLDLGDAELSRGQGAIEYRLLEALERPGAVAIRRRPPGE